MKQYKFIISGGGTGGHIYPAISIADRLLEVFPKSDITFVGSIGRMEMKTIPKYGYKIKGLFISGLKRKIYSFTNLFLPFKLLISFLQSISIIVFNKPDFVIGTGGYASFPIVYVSTFFRIPTLIQEQNSYPGITNIKLGKRAHYICIAYKNAERFFPKYREHRKEIESLRKKEQVLAKTLRLNMKQNKKLTGSEVNKIIKESSSLKRKMADLEESFLINSAKVLNPNQQAKLGLFKNKMMRNMKGKMKDKKRKFRNDRKKNKREFWK